MSIFQLPAARDAVSPQKGEFINTHVENILITLISRAFRLGAGHGHFYTASSLAYVIAAIFYLSFTRFIIAASLKHFIFVQDHTVL